MRTQAPRGLLACVCGAVCMHNVCVVYARTHARTSECVKLIGSPQTTLARARAGESTHTHHPTSLCGMCVGMSI